MRIEPAERKSLWKSCGNQFLVLIPGGVGVNSDLNLPTDFFHQWLVSQFPSRLTEKLNEDFHNCFIHERAL
jgi:hypothetical protein